MSYQQAKIDLQAVRNDTFIDEIEIYEQHTGNPFNFTDYTAKMHVRQHRQSKIEVELDSEATEPEIIMTPGLVKLKKPAAAMDINEGTYQYDIQFTNTDGDVMTLLKGEFTVTDDITYSIV